MSVLRPELEIVDRSVESVRYLQHGWPTDLCRWHAHAEYELHFITATSGTAFVGDYIGDFSPKSLFLTGPNVPHNWVTDSAKHHQTLLRDKLVQFSQDSIGSLVMGFPEFSFFQPLLATSNQGVEFKGFDVERIEAFFNYCAAHSGLQRVVALLDILAYLCGGQGVKILPLSVVDFGLQAAIRGRTESQIGAAVDFVVQNFADTLSVRRVSKKVGLSETNFSRRFKEITGNRFTEFVNRVRVGEACARLQQTPDPISAICYDVGFQNLANFNRHFQKMKGMTPTEYRNQMRVVHTITKPEPTVELYTA